MDLQIRGRNALITGGSQGIGLAAAQVLAREGANVVIAARDQNALDAALTQLRLTAVGGSAAVVMDVTDPESVISATAAATDSFGTIDILVNNAGGVGSFAGFEELTDEDWASALNLNFLSAVRVTRAVLPGMRSRDWGRIVNVSSESALQPDAVFPHYAAAKAALSNFTKSLSKTTAGTGIRVNAVSPAMIKTAAAQLMLDQMSAEQQISQHAAEAALASQHRPGITVGRMGLPEEVAIMIAILSSELASFMDGSNFRVDSGSVATV